MVTITCRGGTPGDSISIPNCTPLQQTIPPAPGTLTCTGTGGSLGNNPPFTVTDQVTGQTTGGTVPLVIIVNRPITITTTITGGPINGITGTYTVSVTCDAPNQGPFTGVVTLIGSSNTGSTVVDVPATATNCTASETARPTAPTGYRWGGALPTGIPASGASGPTLSNTVLPLDPPFVVKRGRVVNETTIEWTITVINNVANNAGQAPVPVVITDALPSGVTLIGGSVACTPTSAAVAGNSTTVATCEFNTTNTALSVTGNVAYSNTNDANAASAPERLTIMFLGTVAQGQTFTNTACAANSAAPNATTCGNSTTSSPGVPIPVNALWMLMLLAALLAGAAKVCARRRT